LRANSFFQDEYDINQLAAELDAPADVVRQGMAYWTSIGIIAESGGHYRLLDASEQGQADDTGLTTHTLSHPSPPLTTLSLSLLNRTTQHS